MKPRVQLMGALVAALLLAAVLLHLRPLSEATRSSGPAGVARPPAASNRLLVRASTATRRHAPTASSDPASTSSPACPNACQEFNAWLREYLALPPTARAEAETEGVALAQSRRAELRRMITGDPERAWNLRIPWSIRRELPSAIAAQLEEVVSGRGDLAVLGALPVSGQQDGFRPIHRVATVGGRSYQAFVFGRRADQPTRVGLSLHGIAVDDALALADSPLRVLEPGEPPAAGKALASGVCPVSGKTTAAGAGASPAGVAVESGDQVFHLCSPAHIAAFGNELWQQEDDSGVPVAIDNFGRKPVLVMIVDFPDRPGANTSSNDVLVAMSEVDAFYRANSFQQLVLDPIHVTPVLRLPRSSTNYVDLGPAQLLADARSIADALGFHESGYRFDIVTFPQIGFPWSGSGYIGGKGAFVQGPIFNARTVEHELGHNLGNWHAGGWLTDDESVIGPGRRLEYGNEFDIMGSGPGQLNANFKYIAGWLTDANVLTVTNEGTYRLHAMDMGGEVNAARSYAVRIPATPPLNGLPSDYWIDFRQQFTNNPNAMNGALLYWATNTAGPDHSQLLDMNPAGVFGFRDAPLAVGRTFVDAVRKIFITPVARGGSGADTWLDITVKFHPTNKFSPTVSLSTSSLAVNPGEAVHFTATASDLDGDALAYFWDFGDGSLPENSLNQPGLNKSWAAAGEYFVRCTVSDMKGREASAAVLVRVGSPTAYHIAGRVLWGSAGLDGVRVHNGLTGSDYVGTFTDGAGQFVLTGLPAGNYSIVASKLGFGFAPLFGGPVHVGPTNADGLTFRAETNTAFLITGCTPSAGGVGSTVTVRGMNLCLYFFPPSGVWFGDVPARLLGGSSNGVAVTVPAGARTAPIRVTTCTGLSDTTVVPFTVLPSMPVITASPRSENKGVTFNVTFSASGTGSGPLWWQWRKDGAEIPGATNAILWATNVTYSISNLQSNHAGVYDVVLRNPAGAATSAPAILSVGPAATLAEALDTTNLIWSTGGDVPWITQDSETADGVDAAAAYGPSNALSWLETTLTGPGRLTFSWRRDGLSRLWLEESNSLSQMTAFGSSWEARSLVLLDGSHTLRWISSGSTPENPFRVWLDQVSFGDIGAPAIVGQPAHQSIAPGWSATFRARAIGAAPLRYQWELSGSFNAIPGATNDSLTVANAAPGFRGYRVRVWNSFGEIYSDWAWLNVVGAPSIYISAPAYGDELPAGDNIVLEAVASTPLHVDRVEFYEGTTKLGEVVPLMSQPSDGVSVALFAARLVVTNVPSGGSLTFTAVATDEAGQRGTSNPVRVTIVQRLVREGAVWKYLDDGGDPDAAWRLADFDDSAWFSGPAELGYPEAATLVSYGPNETNKHLTTWFRHAFNVPDAAVLSNVVLQLKRVDGAVVYLNGNEVFRSNMPTGEVNFATLAVEPLDGPRRTSFSPRRIDPALLVTGPNLLAAEVHLAASDRPSLLFDLNLTANFQSGPPRVWITSPGDESTQSTGDVLLAAEAFDPDGDVARVEFFVDNVKFGEVAAPPYQLIVSNLPPTWGSYHVLDVCAVDTNENMGCSPFYRSFAVSVPENYRPVFGLRSYWYYRADGGDPGTAWRDDPQFVPDTPWRPVGAPFSIPIALRPRTDPLTSVYFRGYIGQEEWTPPNNAILYLLSELADGAIVYVNGVEVLRRNLPPGPIAPTNYSGFAPSACGYIRAELPPGLFRSDNNFVAVEMHQNTADSTTLIFDLAIVGTDPLVPPGLDLFFDQESGALYLGWDGDYWGAGSLEAADDPSGPWSEVIGGGQGSYIQEFVQFNGTQRFYRLRK